MQNVTYNCQYIQLIIYIINLLHIYFLYSAPGIDVSADWI